MILRVDLDDSTKSKVIADFLEIDEFKITRSNIGNTRPSGVEYKNFLKTIELPDDYLDKNLSSKFTKHFFSSAEILDMHDKWKVR